jgi:Sigma-70 region 2
MPPRQGRIRNYQILCIPALGSAELQPVGPHGDLIRKAVSFERYLRLFLRISADFRTRYAAFPYPQFRRGFASRTRWRLDAPSLGVGQEEPLREDRRSTRRPKPGPEALPPGRTGEDPSRSGDSRLVQRAVGSAKEGDCEGLHFLYVRFAPDVLDCVASVVSDRSEVEEITRGVFIDLVRTIDEYEEREGPFGAWILRIARNAADRMRAGRTP